MVILKILFAITQNFGNIFYIAFLCFFTLTLESWTYFQIIISSYD